jgi:hypothetical protein
MVKMKKVLQSVLIPTYNNVEQGFKKGQGMYCSVVCIRFLICRQFQIRDAMSETRSHTLCDFFKFCSQCRVYFFAVRDV